MVSITAARRYAKGLLELGIERKQVDSMLKDMQMIRATMEASPALQKVLVSPVVKDEKKKDIVLKVFDKKVSDLTLKLIDILSQKNRLGLLYGVTTSFESLYNTHAGILEIIIQTAFELDAGQVDKLVKAISASTGKKIKHTVKLDKNLIGGVAIKYGDTVIDGSVRNKLEQLTGLLQVSAV